MPTSTKNVSNKLAEVTAAICAKEVVDTIPLFSRFIGTEMRRNGDVQVSMPQLKVLSFINRNPGTSLSSAADDLAVTPATASNLIDRLVRRGYVSRVEDPEERRRVLLSLTETGLAHLEKCRQFAQASVAALLTDLPEAKLAKIKDGLVLLKETFDEVS